jgi:glycosyltransferase involved in cell wall biosynthesis
MAMHGHQIILASFVRKEEEPHVASLKLVCSQVHTIPIRRSRPRDMYYLFRSQVTRRPFLIERDDNNEMRQLVKSIVEEDSVDCIYADQITMTQFASEILRGNSATNNSKGTERSRPILIYDAHNAVWTTVERMVDTAPWFLRSIIKHEAQRVKRYQVEIVRDFDHTFAVTEVDRQLMINGLAEFTSNQKVSVSRKISVFPITVDTARLQPIHRQPSGYQIMTLGTLHYPPNADGIRWFVKEVFPLVRQEIPQAQLTIVGKNPPPDFLQFASSDSEHITVTGYVPELKPYYENASLVVIPVRAGSGMRVRILEAFALGMPTVTTTVGLEGIEGTPGENILVADTAIEFASAVVQLLMDRSLQQKLSDGGRRLAENRYDWRVALNGIDGIFNAIQEA